MNFIKVTFGIFAVLAASRFIPHPPNFTSMIALSFYVPLIFGRKYILSLLICFLITDLFIGFHSTILFTWGSIAVIGLITKYFLNSQYHRYFGVLGSTMIFFILSNFGVWFIGYFHGINNLSLIETYVIAIPFYGNTLISTIIFSIVIEYLISLKKIKLILKKKYSFN